MKQVRSFLTSPQTGLVAATIAFPILFYLYFVWNSPSRSITSAQNLTVIALSLVYLVLSTADDYLINWDAPLSKYRFIFTAMAIGLAINFLAEPGFLWIILLPLVGMAEQTLNQIGRWAMYILTLIGASGPFVLDEGLQGLSSAAFFLPAILFVIVFSRLMRTADKAREKAESLTIELEEANRQLGEYAVQAEELATTQERNRIAREIHDNLGHYLTVVNVQLEAAKVVLDSNPDKAKDAINKAQSLTQEGLTAVRQSVVQLRENPLNNQPLPDAIQKLIRENQSAGIETQLVVEAQPRPLAPNTSLALYRIVQEALTNIRRHSNATTAEVKLSYSNSQQVNIEVSDNGKGAADTQNGFGLMGIRERVNILEGNMQIQTQPNEGFTLNVSVPT